MRGWDRQQLGCRELVLAQVQGKPKVLALHLLSGWLVPGPQLWEGPRVVTLQLGVSQVRQDLCCWL